MNRKRQAQILLILTLALSLTIACAAFGGGASPSDFGFPTADISTPSSPLAGAWPATFQSGSVVFHIAPNGSRVESLDLQLNNWHCGGTTLTTSMQVSGSPWGIDNNQFSVGVDLNPPHVEELAFDGTYDEATKTWSGSWEGDEYGTHCSGKWQSSGHK